MKQISISSPCFGNEEYEAIQKPLKSGWVTQGEYVRQFEESFAKLHNVKYAIATTSCTTALHLMLIAGGIKPGDEVIVPSFTWISTANAVRYCGAKPIFADINLETFNLDINSILKKINKNTKAIVVVHLFGLCFDVKRLRELLPKSIKIFEDAACAAGASVDNSMAGSLGEAAAFSFHPRKSITTGEGGMVTTNNIELASLARKLRNHGAEISEEERHNGSAPYHLPEFNLIGYNYRMTDLQAAIGLVQTNKLISFVKHRKAIAHFYAEGLKNCEWLEIPAPGNRFGHAWQAYVLRISHPKGVEFRNKIMKVMESGNISTRPGTHAIHLLGAYKSVISAPEDLNNSVVAANTSLAIPMHNLLTEEDQARVVDTLLKVKP